MLLGDFDFSKVGFLRFIGFDLLVYEGKTNSVYSGGVSLVCGCI